MITLEALAQELGCKVRNDRIYIWDLGYHTKKTKCNTYIYIKDDEFRAACYIECPSQSPKWIANEEAKIRAKVMERVAKACERIKVENLL